MRAFNTTTKQALLCTKSHNLSNPDASCLLYTHLYLSKNFILNTLDIFSTLSFQKMGQRLDEQLAGAGAGVAPRFTTKKGGVIPAKKKLVKKMIFIELIQSLSLLLHFCCHFLPLQKSHPKNTSCLRMAKV